MGKQETKDKIRGAKDLKSEKIHVDEWDIDIEVRGMNAKARSRILKAASDDKGKVDNALFQWALLMESCFDAETGEKLLTDEDSSWMMEKSFNPIERICAVAVRLSGLGAQVQEALTKNSNSVIQSENSISL